jgi:hypothetical protein
MLRGKDLEVRLNRCLQSEIRVLHYIDMTRVAARAVVIPAKAGIQGSAATSL